MTTRILSDGLNDLVEDLKELEDYFPLLGINDERRELEDEVRELQELVSAAGEAADEQSMRALTYLQGELLRKREMLENL